MGKPSSVPTVPGAKGDSPVPKPSAMNRAGCASMKPTVGRRIALATKVVKALAFDLHNYPHRVTDRHRPRHARADAPDARQGETQLGCNRRDSSVCIRSGGESEFVIVAAGEQAFLRQALVRTGFERTRARQLGIAQFDGNAGALAEMADVSHQAVRDIDGARRQPAQRQPQRYAG